MLKIWTEVLICNLVTIGFRGETMDEKDFLEWESYSEKIVYLDDFFWRQKIRKQNEKNISTNQ